MSASNLNTFTSSSSKYNLRVSASPYPCSLLFLVHTSMLSLILSLLPRRLLPSLSCLIPRTDCSGIASSRRMSDQAPVPTSSRDVSHLLYSWMNPSVGPSFHMAEPSPSNFSVSS